MRVLLLTLAILFGIVLAEEEQDFSYSSMFDSDSEFMKGFETGILLRSKNGSVQEFGCKAPEKGQAEQDKAFQAIEQVF